jgi:hypothetical protein
MLYRYIGGQVKALPILPGAAVSTGGGGVTPPGGGGTTPTRPTGPNYVTFESLYVTGDTLTQTFARLTSAKIVTFPEGQFNFSDFTTNQAGFTVPAQCMGIVGSGKGTLGGSTGTVFRMVPNSSTAVARGLVPAQGSGTPNQNNMFKFTNAAQPVTFSDFQIAGTAQGHTFHAFQCYATPSGSLFQDLLFTGWEGNAGTPPGETFGIQVAGGRTQTMRRVEADGRRSLTDATVYGGAGATFQNVADSTFDSLNIHHCRAANLVFYQTYNTTSIDGVFDTSSAGSYVIGNGGINFERTSGCKLIRPKIRGLANKVHITFSNDFFSQTIGGQSYSATAGTLEVVDPDYNDAFANGDLFIQSWTPYGSPDRSTTGVNSGNSMTYPGATGTDIQPNAGPSTAPWVHRADGTRITSYVWAFDQHYLNPTPHHNFGAV